MLINKLPKHHKYLYDYLMDFLTDVAAESATNKMSFTNLGIVFGPNMLKQVAI